MNEPCPLRGDERIVGSVARSSAAAGVLYTSALTFIEEERSVIHGEVSETISVEDAAVVRESIREFRLYAEAAPMDDRVIQRAVRDFPRSTSEAWTQLRSWPSLVRRARSIVGHSPAPASALPIRLCRGAIEPRMRSSSKRARLNRDPVERAARSPRAFGAGRPRLALRVGIVCPRGRSPRSARDRGFPARSESTA